MGINREQLKRMIDQITEQDVVEVFDFVGYLNMKREKEMINQLDVEALTKDKNLVDQVQKSREDRKNNLMYSKESGLEYLRSMVKEFEREQNL
ncbi:hypothetical protein LG329_13650 [Virgibacillus necropolis]|uniref:hypothetical protein n=1 Tax=Virgibacillus necropolis TaxID=163877 RepID=UPI00384DFE81